MNKIRLVVEFTPQNGVIQILEGPLRDAILMLGMLDLTREIYLNVKRQEFADAGRQIVVPKRVPPGNAVKGN